MPPKGGTMSSALYGLGRWAFRHRGVVVMVWLVVLFALFALAGILSAGTDNTYRIPGTESQQALDALSRTFPQVSGASAQLIAVAPRDGSVTDADFEAAVEASVTAIGDIPQVAGAASPYSSTSSANIAADDSAVLVPIQLSVGSSAVLPSTAQALQDAGAQLEEALPDGSEVAVGGQLFSQTSTGISATELVGIAVAFVVLLLTFGSLIAAGLPLITALLGVGASLSIVLAATGFTTITSTTPLLALMLGLAVGIDYALFLLARHQDQLKLGIEPEEAAARSVATSGSAVVFAALTVIIALLGLTVAGIPFLTTMGVAAALAVAMAVAVSLTLIPALLGFARWRVVPRRYRPGRRADAAAARPDDDEVSALDADDASLDDVEEQLDDPALEAAERADAVHSDAHSDAPGGASEAAAGSAPRRRGFFPGWVRAVTAQPIVTVVLVVGVLGLAAVPAAQLRLALPDAGSLEEDAPARIAYDLISEHFGPGYNGPLLMAGLVIESSDPVSLMDDIADEIRDVPGVAAVPLATPNETGDTGIVQVIPEGAPVSEQTEALVTELRGMHAHFVEEYGVDLAVTGYTAAGIDISERLAGALLPFGIIVVGLSLVLLAMVFRSIVVPVTAALGYVLSIGAALGLTSLVFVDGFLAGPIGVAAIGYVISFMPIILMGVLFGLAMDYEVFLVSRMREDYVHHGDPAAAVRDGFTASARVVTAAAIIMFAVFAAFVPEGDASIQPIAFGLAAGVLIDAFLVRMTLIPAVLTLFGRLAWAIPRWLDRVLPHFDVEGEGLAEQLALADWPGEPAVLAAEGMTVGGSSAPPVDLRLPPGAVLVVHGGEAAERRVVLAALAGRADVTAGRVKVADAVLPAQLGRARARTAFVRIAAGPDGDGSAVARSLDDALASGPRVVMLLGADLAPPEARAELRAALHRAIAEDPTRGFVLSAREVADVEALLPDGSHVVTATLDPEPAEVGS
jgi:RND superfamily putative drug exporter